MKSKEIKNIAVIQDNDHRVIGVAVSSCEVDGRITSIANDGVTKKFWIKTTSTEFFIDHDQFPVHLLGELIEIFESKNTASIFQLPEED